ncbi:MAG: hypothetical protein QXT38_03675, partial [Candidatus Aenigmatarchaeota archaeon]
LDRIDSIESELRKLREEKEKKEDFFGDLVSTYEKEKQLKISDKVEEIDLRLKNLEESLKYIKDEIIKIKEIETLRKNDIDIEKRVSYLENFLKPDKILKFEQIDNFFNKELPKRLDKEFQIRADSILKNVKNLENEINKLKNSFLSKSGEIGFLLKEVKKISDLENEIKKISNEIQSFKKILEELNKDFYSNKQEISIIKVKINEIDRTIDENLKILENFKENINFVQNLLPYYEEVKRNINTLNSDFEKIEYKIKIFDEKLNDLASYKEVEEIKKDIERIKGDFLILNKEIKNLQSNFEINKIESIINSFNGIVRNISIINQRVNNLESILNEGKAIEEMQKNYIELNKEMALQKAQIREIKKLHGELVGHIDKIIFSANKLQNKLNNLENFILEIEKRENVENKLIEIIETLSKLKHSVENEKKNLAILNEEINKIKNRMDKTDKNNVKIEEIIEKTKDFTHSFVEIENKITNILKNIKDLENTVKQKVESYDKKESLIAEIQNKVNKILDAQKEVDNLKSIIVEKDRIKQIEKEIEEIKKFEERIKNSIRELERKTEKIEDSIENKSLEIRDIKLIIRDLENDIKNVKNKYIEIINFLKNE